MIYKDNEGIILCKSRLLGRDRHGNFNFENHIILFVAMTFREE